MTDPTLDRIRRALRLAEHASPDDIASEVERLVLEHVPTPTTGPVHPVPTRGYGGTITMTGPAGMIAVYRHDTWTVDDPEGGTWWPDDNLVSHLTEVEDPAAEVLRVCREAPYRGRWVA